MGTRAVMGRGVVLAVALVALSACQSKSTTSVSAPTATPTPSTSPSTAPVVPTNLAVTLVAAPSIGLPDYRTTGFYPQVTGQDAVNALLRQDVAADQTAYKAAVTPQLATLPNPKHELVGTYYLGADASEVLANTGLVSTMYSTTEELPGGNDGDDWISTTVLLPGATTVNLTDLLPLEAVAREAKAEMLRRDTCPPGTDATTQQVFDDGLSARSSNFKDFAVTPVGIDVGLQQGSVGAAACGTPRLTLTWAKIATDLTPLGKQLQTLAELPGDGAFCNPTTAGIVTKQFVCHSGWAVSYDDADVRLFKESGTSWVKVALKTDQYGTFTRCDLVTAGMPLAVAKQFVQSDQCH